MTIGFDTNILLNYYQSRAGVPVTTGSSGTSTRAKVAPTAPWSGQGMTTAQASAAVKDALLGRKLINEGAAQLDLAGASDDYKKLFALYQGLNTLSGVAERAQAKLLTDTELRRIQSVFAKGLAEVSTYADDAQLDLLRLTKGEAATSARTTASVPRAKTEYVTAPLVSGSSGGVVAAFQGDVKFDIKVKRVNVDHTVSIDLSQMGAQDRTLGNVITFINQKLQDEGLSTRFASQRIAGAPRTTVVGGKTVSLGNSPDQWALKIKADSGETVSFDAPVTAPSVYLTQKVGNPDPDGKASTKDGVTPSQLLKFQTDSSQVSAPQQGTGSTYWVEGRSFAVTLGPEVDAVRASATGPDGSVYVLADVSAKIGGQTIKGEQDVALLKYDSAGNVVYRRTLGASDTASGLALAISADGQVAIAGSVKGTLGGAVDGPLNSGATGSFADNTDSFVTLYDKDGQELWTQRRGARADDAATQLTFGADGTVFVAGDAKSTMPGATALGGRDGYIEGFKAGADGKVKAVFTQQFGTASDDHSAGMVMDGTALVVASVENGRAVLRRFDTTAQPPTLMATRDLGDLQGGSIAGIAMDNGQLVIAGTAANPALSAGTITRAHAGGSDAFAARISADLNASGSDRLAYYGGSGDDKATALAVSGGQVWIAGSAGTDLPNQDPMGKKDGFLTRLDVNTGAVDWSRRFTGKDGYAAPTSIAVDATGSSVLDKLGLPRGTIDTTDSTQLTAQTALRAGDYFTVRAGDGRRVPVTIDTKDTLDTLAVKVRRALGFQAKVDIVTIEGGRRLQIKPLNPRSLIEIEPGKGDKDALASLGLPEGLVRATVTNAAGKLVPADGKPNIYGLGLPADLNLSDPDQIKHTIAEIAAAMGVIRTAYKDLVTAATPKSAQSTAAAASGPVPAYLTNQIANYQAALDRLTA
ncbi:hypothetical protein [Phenylobacterium sp.]|uniref:hypothetical protein n=1 Tax=Phenylobacterium sp. TaxID=1871053 RepID=UPI0027363246|nr:hypothetical protein [Phenylobacterium sp.]MDP3658905.1 hypothetical protein [Phenylobacterium sp.]